MAQPAIFSRHQGPESPEAFSVTTAGPIVWASRTMLQAAGRQFNQWTLTSGGQASLNGHIDPVTSLITELVYHDHTLFQGTSRPDWYYWNTTTSDGTPGTAGWVFFNLLGPITLSALTYAAGAVAGTVVASVSVPMSANAAGDTFGGVFGGTLTIGGADAASFAISGANLVVAAGHTLSNTQYNVTISAQIPVGSFNLGTQLGPTAFQLTQTSANESAEGFSTQAIGTIVFASQTNQVASSGPFNQFAITSGAQITLNGNVTPSSNVTTLTYHNHSLFQVNASLNWFYWNTTTSDATPGTPGYVAFRLAGPITVNTTVYQPGATAGSVVATVSVPMQANAAGDTFPGVWGGTLSLSGTDAANFAISGMNIVVATGHTLSTTAQTYNVSVSARVAAGATTVGNQLGPTAFAITAQPESAEGFAVSTVGPITYASLTNRVASTGPFNRFALTAGGQITRNEVLDPVTSAVIQLLYHNHSFFQENSTPNWFYWNSSTSDGSAGVPGWVFFNLLGPITLSASTYAGGATAGTTVATISVPMSANAANDTFFSGLWGSTLTLAGADAANFVISGANLNVAAGHTLSTTNQTYNITISAQVPVGTFNVGNRLGPTGFALTQAAATRFFTPVADANGNLINNYQLVLDDEFNGTAVDTTKWFKPTNNPGPGSYSNNRFFPANSAVANGFLQLAVTQSGTTPPFNAGIITTGFSTGNFHYGQTTYIEGRIRVPNAANGAAHGMVPAFWGNGSYTGGPGTDPPELDIFEWHGHFPSGLQPAIFSLAGQFYVPNPQAPWTNSGARLFSPGGIDLSAAFHVYGCLYEPGKVTWYMDGQVMGILINGQTDADGLTAVVQNNPICIVLNNSANLNGEVADTSTVYPNIMYVDYVHVYTVNGTAVTPQANYGGPGDSVGSGNTP